MHHSKYLIIVFCLLGISPTGKAQSTTSSDTLNRWTVKVAPLGLINFISPNLHLATAYRFHERQVLQLETTYHFIWPGYNSIDGQNLDGAFGYRLRGEYRYLFPRKRKEGNWFVGADVMWQQRFIDRTDWVLDPSGQYLQNTSYRKIANYIGGDLTFGQELYFGDNDRFYFEYGAYLGFTYKTIENIGIREGTEVVTENWAILNPLSAEQESSYYLPRLGVILRFGISF